MSLKIHPTAIINKKAELGENVEVGPYCVIDEEVFIEKNVKIEAAVYVTGLTRIGEGCHIHYGAVIGKEPQIKNYKKNNNSCIIGKNNIIREYVTIHAGKDLPTTLGNNNYIMANVHIAHDCQIGSSVVITNFAGLTGHVVVEDMVTISGLVGVHQFVRIGKLSIIGGNSKVVQDVPPFSVVDGHPASVYGLNIVGLRRAGIEKHNCNCLKRAYKILYSHNLKEALKRIENDHILMAVEEVVHLVNFIKASKRGVLFRSFKRR